MEKIVIFPRIIYLLNDGLPESHDWCWWNEEKVVHKIGRLVFFVENDVLHDDVLWVHDLQTEVIVDRSEILVQPQHSNLDLLLRRVDRLVGLHNGDAIQFGDRHNVVLDLLRTVISEADHHLAEGRILDQSELQHFGLI